MKSGIAAFVARGIALPPATPTGTISLAITNDEEADAINGTDKLMAWAAAQGHRFDFAIVGEPSATATVGDSIKIGRRGSLNGRDHRHRRAGPCRLSRQGEQPAAGRSPRSSRRSSGKLDDGTAHFPPSNLEFTSIDVGNETTNVIPARGAARFNVRFNDSWTPETLETLGAETHRGRRRARMRDRLSTRAGRPSQRLPLPAGRGGRRRSADHRLAITGSAAELSTGGGTSDARFIAQYCPVVECGLPGPTMHRGGRACRASPIFIALTELYRRFVAAFLDLQALAPPWSLRAELHRVTRRLGPAFAVFAWFCLSPLP